MKKLYLLSFTVVFLLASISTLADDSQNIADILAMVRSAQTLDAQLGILDEAASTYAAELENGGWDVDLNVSPVGQLPDGFLPNSWDDVQVVKSATLPDEFAGLKLIALRDDGGEPSLAGNVLARLPEESRAASLEEAGGVLIIRHFREESSREYTIGKGYNRCYQVLAHVKGSNLYYELLFDYTAPPLRGTVGSLVGEVIPEDTLWIQFRAVFFGNFRVDFGNGTSLVFRITGDTCYVEGYEGEPTDIVIPSDVNDYPVSGIGESAFYGCTTLISLKVPEGVTWIGKQALCDATSLESLSFPSTLITVGDMAIMNCDHLASLVIPEGVTELVDAAVRCNDNLRCIYLPSSLSSLTPNSFFDGATIYTPESSVAFTFAQKFEYEVIPCIDPSLMPEVNTYREGDYLFSVMNGLAAVVDYDGTEEDVVIPNTLGDFPVVEIGSLAFNDTPSTIHSVTVPDGVTTLRIGWATVSNRNGEVYVYLPSSVVKVSGCNKYIVLYIPEDSKLQEYLTQYEYAYRFWDPNHE